MPTAPAARPRRPARDPRIGPVRITPARTTLVVALAGGLAFLGWSVIVRDQLQVPLMATGFAVVGVVLGALAVLAVGAIVRAGRERRDAQAVLLALLGGSLAIAALLCLAAAWIFGVIWSGTPGG